MIFSIERVSLLIISVEIRTKQLSSAWLEVFCFGSVVMNAEVAFLVFVLYFYLFLDLYSSLEKLFNANGINEGKKSWHLQKNFFEQKEVRRKEMATCVNMKENERAMDFPEIAFYRERLQPRARENERMINTIQQKSRLWGRG